MSDNLLRSDNLACSDKLARCESLAWNVILAHSFFLIILCFNNICTIMFRILKANYDTLKLKVKILLMSYKLKLLFKLN